MIDHHTDLPLFRWTPPQVEVIPFPASKRIGHIRRTASRLVGSRTNREADAYWSRAVESLQRQMEKAGIPQERITAERAAFRDAVQAEIHRLQRHPRRQPDGGAA